VIKLFQLKLSKDVIEKLICQELHVGTWPPDAGSTFESICDREGGGGALVFDDAQLSSRLPDVQFASDAGP
jgi:hypothetical protein